MHPYKKHNFAIVLNANARRVTERVKESIINLVPRKNIYFSKSLEDSKRIAKEIIEKGYEAVFTGGGDGTVIQFINDLCDAAGDDKKVPYIGILTLGTGNALARMVSSANYLYDLQSYMINRNQDIQKMYFVNDGRKRYPFGGLGWDAEILNDYRALKEKYGESILKPILQNVGGYFLGFFLKTVPRNIKRAIKKIKPTVKLTALSDESFMIDGIGDKIKSFKKGEVMFEGKAGIVIIGTTPYFGYGMKLLPHTTLYPGFMEIRVGTLSIPEGFFKLKKMWKGEYSGDGVKNFIVKHAKIETDMEMPYQIGGDAEGYVTELELFVDKRTVDLLRFI